MQVRINKISLLLRLFPLDSVETKGLGISDLCRHSILSFSIKGIDLRSVHMITVFVQDETKMTLFLVTFLFWIDCTCLRNELNHYAWDSRVVVYDYTEFPTLFPLLRRSNRSYLLCRP